MATICMLTFCIRSPTGRIIVSPGPRVPGSTLPNLKMMPCSYCCTIRNDRPSPVSPSTTIITNMTTMAATITNTSSPVTVTPDALPPD